MSADNRLILAALDQESIPLEVKGGLPGLINELQDCGFIDTQLAQDPEQTFKSGKNFMDHISLVGCSPVYALDPDIEEPSGIVSFSPISDEPQFIYGSNSMTPKCPECREPLTHWKDLLAKPLQPCNTLKIAVQCHHCQQQNNLTSLRFRREAAVGRFFIFVHGIFPREAVPMDGLLQMLEKFMGSPMAYYYCQGK